MEPKKVKKKKNEDRHIGKRVEFYIPLAEYSEMLEGMAAMHETNKSVFVRSAIKSFCDFIKNQKEGTK